MKKSIIKKIFIKISKFLGYEIIDQNEFYSPTLNKELNENLSSISKSIVLPMGEVNLSRKVKSLLILFRTNTNVEIWDQNRKRIFENPKIEYVLRCLNSLIKSIKILEKKNSKINIDLKIIDSSNSENNINRINNLINLKSIKADIIKHQSIEHNDLIMDQSNKETFSNLSSLLKCFEIGRDSSSDLIYFVEDDYLHFETALEEMISTFERVSSQLKKVTYNKLHVILGFVKGKNIKELIAELPAASNVYYTSLKMERGMTQNEIRRNVGGNIIFDDNTKRLIEVVKKDCTDKDLILITGSNFIAKNIYEK